MKTAFLLKFQEPCPDDMPDRLMATQTATRTHGEGRDTDPHAISHAVLPRGAGRFQGDRSITLPEAATKTATAVRSEATDSDPDRKTSQYFPRCSSFSRTART
jgi:hypothetical protein